MYSNKEVKKYLLPIIVSIVVIGIAYVIYGIISFRDVPKTHIQANVPESENFDQFLKRDLEEYFDEKFEVGVSIQYDLLKDTPTQTGLAFPKYYAWVTVFSGAGTELEQGVVRLAAMERQYFTVTDYKSLDEINSNLDQVNTMFPREVGEKIKLKVQTQAQN